MSRSVYTVHGSEDGVLGVYGAFRRAFDAAVRYAELGDGSCRMQVCHEGGVSIRPPDISFTPRDGSPVIISGRGIEAVIETFQLE
jgi:hypothetical protein